MFFISQIKTLSNSTLASNVFKTVFFPSQVVMVFCRSPYTVCFNSGPSDYEMDVLPTALRGPLAVCFKWYNSEMDLLLA